MNDEGWRRFMNNFLVLVLLAVAAGMESGGDALARMGLQAGRWQGRVAFLGAGAVVLFAYGVTVNLPPWNFGKLLGVYVALFFVVAQGINWFAFGVRPGVGILVGGTMIVAGGMVITFWRG